MLFWEIRTGAKAVPIRMLSDVAPDLHPNLGIAAGNSAHRHTPLTFGMASCLSGGPGGIRTHDLCVANAALSQLSYKPKLTKRNRQDAPHPFNQTRVQALPSGGTSGPKSEPRHRGMKSGTRYTPPTIGGGNLPLWWSIGDSNP